MKFVSVVITLVVIVFVQCDIKIEDVRKINKKYLKHHLTKAKNDYLKVSLKKVEKHCHWDQEGQLYQSYEECLNRINDGDDNLTVCPSIEKMLLNCTVDYLKALDGCLPEKSRGLPILVTKSLHSVVDYLCKQTVENVFELVNPCTLKDNENESESQDQCDYKWDNLLTKYNDMENLPSQRELCRDAISFRYCFDVSVSSTCKNLKTRRVFSGLYTAMLAPCNYVRNVNN